MWTYFRIATLTSAGLCLSCQPESYRAGQLLVAYVPPGVGATSPRSVDFYGQIIKIRTIGDLGLSLDYIAVQEDGSGDLHQFQIGVEGPDGLPLPISLFRAPPDGGSVHVRWTIETPGFVSLYIESDDDLPLFALSTGHSPRGVLNAELLPDLDVTATDSYRASGECERIRELMFQADDEVSLIPFGTARLQLSGAGYIVIAVDAYESWGTCADSSTHPEQNRNYAWMLTPAF